MDLASLPGTPSLVIQAFFLSLGQFGDRRIVAVFLKSLALTLALLGALGVAAWYGFRRLAAWWELGARAQDVAGVLAVVLFRGLAMLVIGIFADDVVHTVERKHYPDALAQARDVPLGRSIAMGLASFARFVVVNVALVPIYLILIATGIGPAVLFFVVNGWLLGRDMGDMVAARHLSPGDLAGWRGSTATGRFVLGLIGTGLFVVPVVNLAAPVIVMAMATHWFHRGRRV